MTTLREQKVRPEPDATCREIGEKTDRLVRLMAEHGLGGILITSQHNFAWLTAGGTNGIDLSRDPGAGALLVARDGRRFVVSNAIEMPRLLEEELAGQEYAPIEFPWIDDRADPSAIVRRAQGAIGSALPLGCDLPLAGAQPVEALISAARYELTAEEVGRYRALGRDSGEVLEALCRHVEPGLTERDVARLAQDALAARGMRGVVMLVAADDRIARYRHPFPTDARWRRTLLIAVNARRGGLTASLTRIVRAGGSSPASDDVRVRTRATAEVNARLLAASRPGAIGRELFAEAARAYAAVGFPREEERHHQGGPIGYRTRDWVAHPASDDRLRANQAVAWNPSITGTKVEETCLVTEEGVEVLTGTPEWPAIEIEAAGRVFRAPDVLSR